MRMLTADSPMHELRRTGKSRNLKRVLCCLVDAFMKQCCLHNKRLSITGNRLLKLQPCQAVTLTADSWCKGQLPVMYMHSNFMIVIMQTSQVIARGLAVCFLALHAGVWQLCCSKTELLGLLLCLHTKVRLAEKAGRSGRVAPVSLASDRVNTLPPQRCSSDRLNACALPVKL